MKSLFLVVGLMVSAPVMAQMGIPNGVVVRAAEYNGRSHLAVEQAGQEP